MFKTDNAKRREAIKYIPFYLKLDPMTQLYMHCFTMKFFSDGYEYIKKKM